MIGGRGEVRGPALRGSDRMRGRDLPLPSIGRGDLVEYVADKFFDRFERHNELVGDVTSNGERRDGTLRT